MNAITEAPVSAQTLEHVLGTGDLSKLTPRQRVEYMTRTCDLIGLNPLTRPFRFLTFQGQTTMYATRDCADQLRKLHKISLTIVDKQIDSEIYIVTARAKTPDGRTDEDMGTVPFGKAIAGELRANAILKAITKAKRRVTLSICGLGFLDESEVETLHGAKTFDAEPAQEGEAAQPAPARSEPARETEAPPSSSPSVKSEPAPAKKRTVGEWLDNFETELSLVETDDDLRTILVSRQVNEALQRLRNGALDRLHAMIEATRERLQASADDAAEAAIEEPEMTLP